VYQFNKMTLLSAASRAAAARVAMRSTQRHHVSSPRSLQTLATSSHSADATQQQQHRRNTTYTFRSNRRFFSSLSSLNEPTLFTTTDTSSTNPTTDDQSDDALLRSDVRVMGTLLGDAISTHHGRDVLEKVEALRTMAKESRRSGDSSSERLQSMVDFVSGLSATELVVVSRAFAHFLGVANAAEAHQRCRRLKLDLEREVSGEDVKGLLVEGAPTPVGALHATKRDSTAGVLSQLVYEKNVSKEEVFKSLTSQTVEIVLTAHPTQVNRRTLLEKHGRVQKILNDADGLRESGTPYQRKLLDDALRREIASIWQTDEVSRVKPTPQSEAERGTLVVETVLWEALPSFLRKLDATMKWGLGEKYGLPLTASPFKFASWMGGDRDGNPNVTPDVTREVCLTNRIKAAQLLEGDVRELMGLISGNPPSVGTESEAMQRVRERSGDSRAPYRAYLNPVATKLANTATWAQQELRKVQKKNNPGLDTDKSTTSFAPDEVYLHKDELMDELLTVHQSLCDSGNTVVANGRLADIIRKLSSFGLTLVPLDIRQESDRHEEALNCITKYLGLGSYSQWDEGTRVSWITKQLQSKQPLIRDGAWNQPGNEQFFTPTSIDTLETFKMISDMHEESLGAYVISQCTSVSDILAVLLLQLDAGVNKTLRVVPLFETLDDLNGAAATMEHLFSIPAYVGSLEGRKQEIMVGYSDSAKDAGRLAASWAQYETQVTLSEVAKKHSVDVVYFHGKGGTVGRGGNPNTFEAILSHAPGTINGQFRVTEQGEMINQNFGFSDRAERTLDIYTAALLAEQNTDRPLPTKEWKDMMDKLSQISCDAYRKIVRGDERFGELIVCFGGRLRTHSSSCLTLLCGFSSVLSCCHSRA
jgi:phosphoenolpyruvate carboxylase